MQFQFSLTRATVILAHVIVLLLLLSHKAHAQNAENKIYGNKIYLTNKGDSTEVFLNIPSKTTPGFLYTNGDGSGKVFFKSPSDFIPTDSSDRLEQPGYVTWSGTGLTFNVTAAVYYINGTKYTSNAGQVTLAPASITNPRYDVIALNTTGQIVAITGDAVANPDIPQIDPSTQIYLTAISVPENATKPGGITQQVVYDENTEPYTGIATGVSVNFDNTATPQHLSKSADVGTWANGNTITFTKNSGTATATDYSTVKFYIKLKGTVASTANIRVSFLNGNTAVSNVVTLAATYGFTKTQSASYQNISIPLTAFSFATTTTFNKLRITLAGAGPGFFLDYVQLQGGITTVPTIETDPVALGKSVSDYAGYGIKIPEPPTQLVNFNPTHTIHVDTFSISTRAWRNKLGDSLATIINTKLSANQPITLTASNDITGSATGTTSLNPALTVTGLRGKTLPALSAGVLKYNGTSFVFDNTPPAAGGKFGLDDNTGIDNRYINMDNKQLGIDNANSFWVTSGDMTGEGQLGSFSFNDAGLQAYNQSDGNNNTVISSAPNSATMVTTANADEVSTIGTYPGETQQIVENATTKTSLKITPSSASIQLNSPTALFRQIPLSVNGNFADVNGNITVTASASNAILNQFTAKQTANSWYDTTKVIKTRTDSLFLSNPRYPTMQAITLDSATSRSGMAFYGDLPGKPYPRSVRFYWSDTSTFNIDLNTSSNLNQQSKILNIAAIGGAINSGVRISGGGGGSGATMLIGNQNGGVQINPGSLTVASAVTAAQYNGSSANLYSISSGNGASGFPNSTIGFLTTSRPANSGNANHGTSITLQAQPASQTSPTNNLNGGSITIAGGTSTGTGTSTIVFKTAPPGASGNADNLATTKMTIDGSNVLVNTRLEINSTTQGFLPPRMTAAQASAITSPAEGLMLYVTDTNGTFTSKGWYGFNGTAWEKLNN